jgi:hypothetical protein
VRKALLLGLAIVLAVTALAVVACGGSNAAAKATLSAALDKIETEVTAMQTQFTAGGTVAQLKTAKDQIGVDWQAVMDAAKNVKGADVAAAQKAWTDVDTAITAVPDTATLVEAATTILAPIQALMKVEADLRVLAGPSTSSSS